MKRPFLLISAVGVISLAVWWSRSGSSLPVSTQELPSGSFETQGLPSASVPPLPASPARGEASQGKSPILQGETGTEDLKRVIGAVQGALPKKSEVKPADDEAAHHAGPELIRAGQALGDLAEYLERRPEEFKAASVFYANCAADEALMPASRAVCYAALSKKKDEWAPGVAERISRVGPEIIDIAKNLSE